MDDSHKISLSSIKTAQNMDGNHESGLLSIKTAKIMDGRKVKS